MISINSLLTTRNKKINYKIAPFWFAIISHKRSDSNNSILLELIYSVEIQITEIKVRKFLQDGKLFKKTKRSL